jgi:hypothetical protein
MITTIEGCNEKARQNSAGGRFVPMEATDGTPILKKQSGTLRLHLHLNGYAGRMSDLNIEYDHLD